MGQGPHRVEEPGRRGPGGETIWPALGAYAGGSYLRYSFTRGTEQEVGFLWEALDLRPGCRVLDVGCGPGRHALALARRGARVVGVDLTRPFLRLAHDGWGTGSGRGTAAFVQGDVRRLPVRPASFDAAICLCQGGFGLLGGADDENHAMAAMAAALRPDGRLALTGFSSWYAVRWMAEGETFDAGRGVLEETATVRRADGAAEREFPLASTCFTPRELRLMATAGGLSVEGVWSVEPGRYGRNQPTVDLPEWLMLARA